MRLYEEPPTEALTVDDAWGEVRLSARTTGPRPSTTADPGTPHNEARDEVWEALLDVLVDQLGGEQSDG